jgi:hypothetical protein
MKLPQLQRLFGAFWFNTLKRIMTDQNCVEEAQLAIVTR